jgi:hypothetical protein
MKNFKVKVLIASIASLMSAYSFAAVSSAQVKAFEGSFSLVKTGKDCDFKNIEIKAKEDSLQISIAENDGGGVIFYAYKIDQGLQNIPDGSTSISKYDSRALSILTDLESPQFRLSQTRLITRNLQNTSLTIETKSVLDGNEVPESVCKYVRN